MSIHPEKKSSHLAPLADEYEPTEADAERVFAKIEASLAGAAPSPSRPEVGAATNGMKKGLLVGVACVAMAVVGMTVFESSGGPSADAEGPVSAGPVFAEPSPAAEAPRERDVGERAAAIPSVSVDALPTAVVAGPTPKDAKRHLATAVSAPAPAASPPSDELEREARLLASARRALQAGDGERSLALLAEHERTFPNGWLAADRTAERIVVLCSLGRRDQAVREAKVFLEGRPKGPLTRRVELSCAAQP